MPDLPDGVTEALPGESWGALTDEQRASVVKLAAQGHVPATLWACEHKPGRYAGYKTERTFIGIELNGYAHS